MNEWFNNILYIQKAYFEWQMKRKIKKLPWSIGKYNLTFRFFQREWLIGYYRLEKVEETKSFRENVLLWGFDEQEMMRVWHKSLKKGQQILLKKINNAIEGLKRLEK